MEKVMPRIAIKENSRLAFRVRPVDKAILMRAVALDQSDLTEFVLKNALKAAKEVIEQAEHMPLSERDSLHVLEILETPPAPNEKLLSASRALLRNL